MFANSIETFFVQRFYLDDKVNDSHIYDALVEVYAYFSGMISELKSNNAFQKTIFEKCLESDKEFSHINRDYKARVILRILKSIRNCSGGNLGPQNYLENIYSMRNYDGKWSHMYSK